MRRRAATAAVLGASLVGIFGSAQPAAAEGEVTIEKLVNDQLADTAPGPTVTAGSTVTYRYLITVAGRETLYDFTVTDTGGATPNCDINRDGQPDGYNAHPGPLGAGDSFICTASQTAGDPGATYASLGRVTAYNFDVSASFTAEDPGHYTSTAPPTTAAPTTSAPTTAAPTTAAPTTEAATTSPETTATTPATDPTTSASSSSSEPPATELARSGAGKSTPGTAIDWNLTTPHPTVDSADPSSDRTDQSASTESAQSGDAKDLDETDLGPPGDLAAATNDDEGGLSLWWSLVLAFAAGGAIALAVSRLTGPETARSRAEGPGPG